MDNVEKLKLYYNKQSKHSQYQSIAPDILALIGPEIPAYNSRHELQRINYISKNLRLSGYSILDIGANTGYFSFEALRLGASSVVAWEGNREHALFLTYAKQLLGYSDKQLQIKASYFDPTFCEMQGQFDFTFLLNVLHHLGDDFGRKDISLVNFKN